MSRDAVSLHHQWINSLSTPVGHRAAPRGLIAAAAAAFLVLPLFSSPLAAQSLRGSAESLDIQNRMARQHDYSYIATTSQLKRFVSGGYLVRIRGKGDFHVHRTVSFPYARRGVQTFLERLGRQYRSACGEQLVVTSLTRPKSRQPYNASSESVHPTGMAIDLRTSRRAQCRGWLENVLLTLERQGVLEATREYHPPHYHIALFPQPYVQYVAGLTDKAGDSKSGGKQAGNEVASLTPDANDPADNDPADKAAAAAEAETVADAGPPAHDGQYQVKAGDSLWEIARSVDVSIRELRTANGLTSDRIQPGQQLRIPKAGDYVATEGRAYRVQSGDSLWEIARSAGVSVLDLRVANGLASERIRPGQQLRIPEPGVYMTASALDYQVQPGDSLWEIAQAHSTSVHQIRRENGLRSDGIHPGQILTVPAGQ